MTTTELDEIATSMNDPRTVLDRGRLPRPGGCETIWRLERLGQEDLWLLVADGYLTPDELAACTATIREPIALYAQLEDDDTRGLTFMFVPLDEAV